MIRLILVALEMNILLTLMQQMMSLECLNMKDLLQQKELLFKKLNTKQDKKRSRDKEMNLLKDFVKKKRKESVKVVLIWRLMFYSGRKWNQRFVMQC